MCMRTKVPHGFDVEAVSRLTSDPNFICKCCGRTANEADNLCSPVPIRK